MRRGLSRADDGRADDGRADDGRADDGRADDGRENSRTNRSRHGQCVFYNRIVLALQPRLPFSACAVYACARVHGCMHMCTWQAACCAMQTYAA